MVMDVKLLKKDIKLLQIEKIFNSVFDFTDAIDEMFLSAKEEMNFEIEAQHMERFRKLNEDVVYIKVPKVYNEYSNPDVLVMEYIDDFLINDISLPNKYGYVMDEIADKLAANYIKQAIDDGFFMLIHILITLK